MPTEAIDNRLKRILFVSYLLIIIVVGAIGILHFVQSPGDIPTRFYVYGIYTIILMVIGALFGRGSKRLIVRHPGDWQRDKRNVSISEYKEIAQAHAGAYSEIYNDFDSAGPCCFTMLAPFLLMLGLTSLISDEIPQSYWFTLDAILLVPIVYLFFGLISYKIGYHSVGFGTGDFYTAPDETSLDFAEVLSDVPGLRVRALIDIGVRAEDIVLFGTEWRALVDDLPDTTYVKLQVGEIYIYPYPYLVGVIYRGPSVEERTEDFQLDTRFPAIVEYSNDREATILVARYDIPSEDSELEHEPNISHSELAKLSRALADRLKQIHSSL